MRNLDEFAGCVIMADETDDLHYLKSELRRKRKIPEENIKLIFWNKVLTDNRPLPTYNIRNDSVVHWQDMRKINVVIIEKGARDVNLSIPKSLPVDILKQRVAAVKKIKDITTFRLTWGTYVLLESCHISDYDMNDGAQLQFHIRFRGAGFPLKKRWIHLRAWRQNNDMMTFQDHRRDRKGMECERFAAVRVSRVFDPCSFPCALRVHA